MMPHNLAQLVTEGLEKHFIGLLALKGQQSVKGGVNLDHFGGAKVDQLVNRMAQQCDVWSASPRRFSGRRRVPIKSRSSSTRR